MMGGTNALLVIVVGMIIIYLAVTGRYKCLTNLISCIGGTECSCTGEKTDSQKVVDAIKPLVPLTPLR